MYFMFGKTLLQRLHASYCTITHAQMLQSVMVAFLLLVVSFMAAGYAHAQSEPELSFARAKVTKVLETKTIGYDPLQYIQRVMIERHDTGDSAELILGSEFQPITEAQLLDINTQIIVAEQTLLDGSREVVFYDLYRTPTVVWLLALFFVIVVIVGRWQGFSSFVGMGVSLGVLLLFVVPQILAGQNPVVISIAAAIVIGSVTLYIAHGWNIKSHIALGSLLLSLVAVASLSYASVQAAQLIGLGSEEAAFLQYGSTNVINLQGLLLGGIILGALGVLDDVTVSQVSVVFQLKLANKKSDWAELYRRGLAVGKDHVASLVNTLVLAYAGANLPLFLLFVLNDAVPYWVVLNSEVLVEEIIRTLTGSIGLVLAVPITTAAAAYFVQKISHKQLEHAAHEGHAHAH